MLLVLPLSEEDLPYRVYLLNHKKVAPFLNTSETFTIENTVEWFRKRNLSNRFDCVLKEENQIIGMAGFVNISKQNSNAELYMYIDPKFQGRGLGKKSLIEVCKYGFDIIKLYKIYCYTFYFNEKANNMYEKVGFIREGYLRKHTMKDGQLRDRCFYGLLADDFRL